MPILLLCLVFLLMFDQIHDFGKEHLQELKNKTVAYYNNNLKEQKIIEDIKSDENIGDAKDETIKGYSEDLIGQLGVFKKF